MLHFQLIEKAATDTTDNSSNPEANMENESEGVNTRGKSGNKNPLAFLGLKRVDVEDEEEDNDIDTNSKISYFDLILLNPNEEFKENVYFDY